MSFARPDLIQSFLEEKRRKKNLESSPLLSEDNLARYSLCRNVFHKKVYSHLLKLCFMKQSNFFEKKKKLIANF